ncbi:hypothetical protein KDD30_13970 [Photobacterium sp. GJ3]|uniref:hypothetical protein n=1 Tax=Photobacterium sp. GJ3 TaxID=2829502 RepID=UPI001B8B5F71|nr:hypothetical protein [Photobacterium sp. GJ3]QUJ67154.1 hypothetical protein KDD30_13970 [Photobacterium sp. GJ3]
MKLVRKTQLRAQDAASEQHDEVALFELQRDQAARYTVVVRRYYRGAILKETQKTPEPVDLARAEKVFDSVVVAKVNQGNVVPDRTARATEHRPVNLGRRIMLEKNPAHRARQIWRLPPEKDPDMAFIIAGYLGHDVWRHDYSLLWTLGRIGSSQHIAMIRPYLRHSNPVLAGLALEVTLSLTEPEAREQSYLAITGQSERLEPDLLREQVRAFCALSRSAAAEQPINDLLKQAYLQALFDPALRQALLALLPDIPLCPGAFKGMRYLLKMSEFRLDADFYAVLNLRVENRKAFFIRDWQYHYTPEAGRMHVQKELASEKARLAYSQKTRHYLMTRCWRTLRQLGAMGSAYYTVMAESLLLGYCDTEHGLPVAKSPILNAIIRTQDPRYQKNARGIWRECPDVSFAGRGEAFPHLWDQAPSSLINIATHSRCEAVSDFAIRALSDSHEACQSLPRATLIALALKPYPAAQQFALAWLAVDVAREPLTSEDLFTLLSSDVAAVNEFALAQLSLKRDLRSDTPLLASLLCVNSAPFHHWLSSESARSALAYLDQNRLLDDCLSCFLATDMSQHQHLPGVFAWLQQTCGSAFARLTLEQVEPLLRSGCPAKLWLGCKCLDAMPIRYSDIRPDVLDIIHSASSEAIRAFSIVLLKKLTPDDLASRLDSLLALLTQSAPPAQEAILAVLTVSMQSRSNQREHLFEQVLQLLNRRKLDQRLQQQLAEFLRQQFDRALQQNHQGALWLLATARSELVQSEAVIYLEAGAARALSGDQWFRLLSSPTAGLRALAQAYFERDPDALRTHPDGLLPVLESPWPDTQAFGFTFCEQQMHREDWPAEQIIAVCDSVETEVQLFGRGLLERYFEAADGQHYLLHLSQHPSPLVEDFVSALLPDYAAGNEAMILALRPYFLSVLSRVNAGRQAKDRVLQFLSEQAASTAQIRDMVCALLTRLSLTSVHKDKAAYLKLMMHLTQAHEAVDLPARIRPRPVRQLAERKE